jgi:hypothetical protein
VGRPIASRPLWLALGIAALLTAFRLTGTVDSDVAWQLWIAGRIHAGANLYRDIVETNPPLWFWMALPVDRLASLLHIRIEAALVLCIGSLVALSLAATERLIRHIEPTSRAWLLAFAALSLLGMPWTHLGQREQIVLIGTLPYVALTAVRRVGKPVPWSLAGAIGGGAALGFALKQYFLIVPVLLELWLLAGEPRRWRLVRAEIVAIAAVGFAYAVALVVLERDFLTDIVPLLRLAYGSFGAPSLRFLFGLPAIVGLLILAFGAGHARFLSSSKAPFASALLVAAAAYAGAYFVQFKGWPYHAIPLIGCASLALAAALAELSPAPRSMQLVAPALLVLPFALTAGDVSTVAVPSLDVQGTVSASPPGTPVGFIAENSAVPWPVTLQRRLRYVSRYNGFWMLGAVHRNELQGNRDPRLAEFGRRVVAQTASDFRCLPPRRIIVARPKQGSWNEHTIDPLPYFLRNPNFAELLSHYRLVSRTTLATYELASPLPPPTSRCRTGI